MRLFGSDRLASMMDKMGHQEGEVIQAGMMTKAIDRAQKKVEENHYGVRKRLLDYDDVINSQREVIYTRRRHALFGDRIDIDLNNLRHDFALKFVEKNEGCPFEDFKLELLYEVALETTLTEEQYNKMKPKDLIEAIVNDLTEAYERKMAFFADFFEPRLVPIYAKFENNMSINMGFPFTDGRLTYSVPVELQKCKDTKCAEIYRTFAKIALFTTIDESWRVHLREMDDLRQSVQNATYEQKDPLLIYKLESFQLFSKMLEDINRTKYHSLTTRSYVEFKFLKDFTFTANYSYDFRNGYSTTYYSPSIGDGQSFNGRGTKASSGTYTTNFNQLLAYNKVVGDHNISAKIGHEYYNYKSDSFSGQKTQFFDPLNPELNNGGQMQYINSSTSHHNIEGYFGMADYNYANKYYVSAAYRRDGTSRFLDRWGDFWSVGLAWRISAEEWMKNAEWINDLKLRASYGTQGNESLLNYTPYQDQYAITWDGKSLGYDYSFYGNPNLTWEKQKTFDVGVDFRLWDRVYGSVEYFHRRTDDMLFQKDLAISAGRPYIYENVGAMSNQGIEVELNVDILKGRDFSWTATLVGSHYKNTVLTLPEENRELGIDNGRFRLMEGHSYYDYYTYKFAGINPETGQSSWYYKVYDDKGEWTGEMKTTEIYADAEKMWIGKEALPDFTGGFNTTFQWKGIDLTIATAFQIGGWAYDSSFLGEMGYSFYVGHHREMWNTWNPETKSGKYAIWNANNGSNSYGQTSDVHLIKASYFSLRNITLGYSLPKNWLQKAGIEKLRVYLTGDNIWLQSKRKGLDPRYDFTGSTNFSYSALSTYSIGLNLTL